MDWTRKASPPIDGEKANGACTPTPLEPVAEAMAMARGLT